MLSYFFGYFEVGFIKRSKREKNMDYYNPPFKGRKLIKDLTRHDNQSRKTQKRIKEKNQKTLIHALL